MKPKKKKKRRRRCLFKSPSKNIKDRQAKRKQVLATTPMANGAGHPARNSLVDWNGRGAHHVGPFFIHHSRRKSLGKRFLKCQLFDEVELLHIGFAFVLEKMLMLNEVKEKK